MSRIATIEAEIDLADLSDDEIMNEVIERGLQNEFADEEFEADEEYSKEQDNLELEKIWLAFRGKECPQVLKDYIWNTIGKMI